jgi:hypothetical protein
MLGRNRRRGGAMLYDVEFIGRVCGKTETLALDMVRLVSDSFTDVIIKADELFRQVAQAHGYRIRDSGGAVVYEFLPQA